VEPLAGSLEAVALTGSMSPSLPGANSTADVRSGGIHGQMDQWFAPQEMCWMPLTPDGIAMCHTRGVETQVEREGILGRS